MLHCRRSQSAATVQSRLTVDPVCITLPMSKRRGDVSFDEHTLDDTVGADDGLIDVYRRLERCGPGSEGDRDSASEGYQVGFKSECRRRDSRIVGRPEQAWSLCDFAKVASAS